MQYAWSYTCAMYQQYFLSACTYYMVITFLVAQSVYKHKLGGLIFAPILFLSIF